MDHLPPELAADFQKLAHTLTATLQHAQAVEQELGEKKAELLRVREELQTVKSKPPEVTLQKVAGFSEPELDKTLNVLEERQLLNIGDREKVASRLRDDPNAALRVIAQVATMHNLPASGIGAGIKRADDGSPAASRLGDAADWTC